MGLGNLGRSLWWGGEGAQWYPQAVVAELTALAVVEADVEGRRLVLGGELE